MRAGCAAPRRHQPTSRCSARPRRRSRCIAGRHRFRLLVHGERRSDMQGFIRALLAAGPKIRGSVRVAVDIDPQSFL